MLTESLRPNVIVRGSILPEPVQVLVVVPMGASSSSVKDSRTRRVHEPILSSPSKSQQLKPQPASIPSSTATSQLFAWASRHFDSDWPTSTTRFLPFNRSRLDPLPHQLEAVYDYFMKLPRIRFLLADDPGAGKTIMAGLLIKELKIRGLVKRTLIVTPANLSFSGSAR